MSQPILGVPVKRLPLDQDAEPRLAHLLENAALLEGPGTLALSGAEWGRCPVGSLELVIESDGTLSLRAEPPSEAALCQRPEDWSSNLLKGETVFGPITIERGACCISTVSVHVEAGSRMEALLHGWKWSATAAGSSSWWAARLSFATESTPTAWFRPTGNVLIGAGGVLHRLWRVELSTRRQAFIGSRHDQWFLLVEAELGKPPSTQEIGDLTIATSFVIGEPITMGLMHQLSASGEITGLARLDLARGPTPTSRQPPALPFMVEPDWLIRFVERALLFMASNPGGIVHVAMHSYLWSLLGTIDMKFLQNWVATEALAGWMLTNGMVAAPPGALLVRDADTWRRWVVAHQAEITSFSADGSGDRLFQRVMSASAKVASKVEKVFVASGLPWTEEMDDVQDIRNIVAHAASIAPTGARDWTRDRRRVGLMQTMHTALLARIIGYDGPIADRSKTCLTPTASDQPTWWRSASLDAVTDYCGSRTVMPDVPGGQYAQ